MGAVRRSKSSLLACMKILVLAVTICSFLSQGVFAADKVDLIFGGGSMGGVYYTIGGAIKGILEQKVPEINKVTVRVGSSSQFAAETQAGKVDLFLNTIDALYLAWSGDGGQGFKQGVRFDNLRLLGVGYTHIFDFVVLEDSPVKALKDIGTKKVGCPSPTMVSPIKELMIAHGIKEPNVVMIADYNQLKQALKDGSVDAFVVAGPQPFPMLTDLTTTTNVRLLELDPAAVSETLKNGRESQFMQKMVVPANTYPWQKEAYNTVGRASTLSVSAKLSDDLVYKITKAIFTSGDEMARVHPQCRDYNLNTLRASLEAGVVKTPLHPGARKFYVEQGIVFPSSVPK